MGKKAAKTIKVTQIASAAGRLPNHRACLLGLGLRRIGQSVVVEDTAAIRGMANKVNYLVRIEEG